MTENMVYLPADQKQPSAFKNNNTMREMQKMKAMSRNMWWRIFGCDTEFCLHNNKQ